MKVGIITICDYKNYGNRLQNYASQEVLKSLGCHVETIVNSPVKIDLNTKSKYSGYFARISDMSAKEILKKVSKKIKNRLNKENDAALLAKKIEAFKNFTNENIKETPFKINKDVIPSNLADDFDFFVVGSDQVWNPTYRNGSSIDFLTFAPKEKRIAFAPSFGVSSIPDEYVENYKLWLSEFKCLSVREKAGSEIIKELTGREAQVLIDPTLMLSKNKWISMSRQAVNKPQDNYLLTYFLGNLSKEKKRIIKKLASKKGLKIVNLGSFDDKDHCTADPAEFIDYINSSSIFLTDSFHGCVFSILLEKPFIVFERESKVPSMNSRIDTLLSKFKLESRKYENIKSSDNVFEVDYRHIGPILDAEREKALEYLRMAVNI